MRSYHTRIWIYDGFLVQNPWFYDILVFKQVTRKLSQAEIALNNGTIYIFKDEFEYVNVKAG